MTTSASLSPERQADTTDGLCAVCAHPLVDHDRISARFCRATQASALSRNCICPSR